MPEQKKKYNVWGHVVGTKYLGTVEASNEDEAAEKGVELDTTYISLCHQCSRECSDGMIDDVSVEEVETARCDHDVVVDGACVACGAIDGLFD
jgi:ferredoxin